MMNNLKKLALKILRNRLRDTFYFMKKKMNDEFFIILSLNTSSIHSIKKLVMKYFFIIFTFSNINDSD